MDAWGVPTLEPCRVRQAMVQHGLAHSRQTLDASTLQAVCDEAQPRADNTVLKGNLSDASEHEGAVVKRRRLL